MPVEGYGAALLGGNGWREGMGIGRNAKADVKVVEYKLRTGKEGIGFMADNPPPVAAVSKTGGEHIRSRSRGDMSEKRKERSRQRERSVEFKEVQREELKRSKEKRIRKERVLWLKSHIRVRIISKEFKGGRFYLKKGVVVDVIGPGLCDLTMDEGREIVQGVDQDILETALPRRGGGRVVVLFGKHKGVYGSLVEKDSEKETGIVQDADSQEMVCVQLDQIAEYIGDPSYLGY